MSEYYFADLRLFVIEQIKFIESRDYESHSTEWFLVRYLKRIEKHTNPPSRKGQVDNSIRALIRFYVDNLDEKSELGECCQKIYDEYRKTIRNQQEN